MKKPFKQLIYVILNVDSKRIKVGVTRDITSRMSSIKSSAGCEMAILYTSDFFYNAEYIEGQIHNELKDYKWGGEWFNIGGEYAVSMVKYVINGNVPYPKNASKIEKVVEAQAIQMERYKKIAGRIYTNHDGTKVYSIDFKDGRWVIEELV